MCLNQFLKWYKRKVSLGIIARDTFTLWQKQFTETCLQKDLIRV